jgi:hypothetical protein
MKKISFCEVKGHGKILILIAIVVVAFAFLVVLLFIHNSGLPQTIDELHWKVGDTWTYSGQVNGLDRTLIEKVVGEEIIDGKDCYVEIMTLEPYPVLFFDADVRYFKLWVEKDTFETKQALLLPEGNFLGMTIPIVTINYKNEFVQEPFPLEVGKESTCNFSERVANYIGEIPPQEFSGRVVSVVRTKENVETPAGTFESFMISTYENDVGGLLIREWSFSPEVLNIVNSESSEAIIERRILVSYDLQPRG